MGCNTKLKIKGQITPEQVVAIIRQDIDKRVHIDKTIHYGRHFHTIDTPHEEYNGHQEMDWFVRIHFIDASDEARTLSYFYSNHDDNEDIAQRLQAGQPLAISAEHTTLSLGMDDEAIEVMKTIGRYLGGYLVENDCHDKYKPVTKDSNPPIVRAVTLRDVYDQFGEVVDILDAGTVTTIE